jgi:hypothetical protein
MDRLADDLFTLSVSQRLLGADLRTRMTVIRIGEELLLHSPVAATDALVDEVTDLGRVRWLVAPCDNHHLYIPSWKARIPDAEILAAPGAARRLKEVQVDGVLPDDVPTAWTDDLGTLFIDGMPKLNETALFHRASKTLILTDFLFNHASAPGWYTKAFLRMTGGWGGPRQTPLLRSMVKDRRKVRSMCQRMLKWDFERITMCHGDVITEDAQEVLRAATAWM